MQNLHHTPSLSYLIFLACMHELNVIFVVIYIHAFHIYIVLMVVE